MPGRRAGVTAAVGAIVARRERVLLVGLAVGLIVALGFALYVRQGSSATPAAIRLARPAIWHRTPAPAFPLHVSSNRRYLVDARGRPFLIVGDSPQALIARLTPAQAGHFFADRERAGFDAMWINLLCDQYTGGRADGATEDGITPFRRAGDLSAPNPAYFARAARMVGLAERHRLAVFLDPIETGGWLAVLRAAGPARAYRYGRYLGRRYRRFHNIVWLSGNDFQTWRSPADDRLALAVARGIRATDPRALQTVELDYPVSASSDDRRWRGLIDLDAAYTYSPTYAEVLRAYRRRPHRPVVMLEASYEGEHDYTGPETLRRQEYWTLLSGAGGQFYGNKETWQFLDGWASRLDTVGSRQLTIATNLFSHRRWFALVPDRRHRLLTSGYGSATSDGDLNDSDYVTAARTHDGRLAIAYLPDGGTVAVDLRRMAGPRVRAQWYDPSDGRYTPIGGSPLRRAGTHRFTAPAANHEGDDDWVLVLTRARQ